MKAQKPAEGILLRHDWGTAKSYEVTCTCTDSDHAHNVWVEADSDSEVSVTVYTRTMTTFWSVSRWRQIWQLLTRGHVESEVALIMSAQQALNYAETLKTAVNDIKSLQEHSHGHS